MSINPAEQKKSADFMLALSQLLDFVESVVPYVKENEYLTAMNLLKTLNDNKQTGETQTIIQIIEVMRTRIERDPIIQQHAKRVKMKVKAIAEHKTDGEKLAKGWECCGKCNRLVRDLRIHQFSDVCKRTNDTKKLSAISSSFKTDDKMILVLKIRAWACKNKWRGSHIVKYYA